MEPCLQAEVYPFLKTRRARMIRFLPLLRFTLRRRSAVVAGCCPEFAEGVITITTQCKHLEEGRLKLGPEQHPTRVVGGAPHGFGVWIDGEFHRVDIGALGTVIVELREELETARKELVKERNPHNQPETCRPVPYGM